MLFAVLLPFVATGPAGRGARRSRCQRAGPARRVGPARQGHPRRAGLLTLAATTEPQDLLRGLERLRMPDLLVQIMGFMIRYLDVVTDELGGCTWPALPRLQRPAPRGTGRCWPGRRRAVHPLLRARRAGAPRDAVARLHRHGCPQGGADEHPGPRRPRARLRLPRRPPGAVRRRPARPPGRAGRAARPQRRRQDHARAAPQRHPDRRAPARVAVSGLPVDQGEPPRDPAPGRHRLPGPRRPAVHGHGPPGRRLRARPTSACGAPSSTRRVHGRARPGRDGRLRRPPAAPPLLRPAPPGRGRHRAGDGAGDPGARRAVVQPRPGLPPRARRHPALAST